METGHPDGEDWCSSHFECCRLLVPDWLVRVLLSYTTMSKVYRKRQSNIHSALDLRQYLTFLLLVIWYLKCTNNSWQRVLEPLTGLKAFSISFRISSLQQTPDLVQIVKLTTPWSLRAVWTAPTDLWLPKLLPLVCSFEIISNLVVWNFLPECFPFLYESFDLWIDIIQV